MNNFTKENILKCIQKISVEYNISESDIVEALSTEYPEIREILNPLSIKLSELEELPNELIAEIIKYLNHKELRILCMTSRRMNEFCLDPYYAKHVVAKDVYTIINGPMFTDLYLFDDVGDYDGNMEDFEMLKEILTARNTLFSYQKYNSSMDFIYPWRAPIQKGWSTYASQKIQGSDYEVDYIEYASLLDIAGMNGIFKEDSMMGLEEYPDEITEEIDSLVSQNGLDEKLKTDTDTWNECMRVHNTVKDLELESGVVFKNADIEKIKSLFVDFTFSDPRIERDTLTIYTLK